MNNQNVQLPLGQADGHFDLGLEGYYTSGQKSPHLDQINQVLPSNTIQNSQQYQSYTEKGDRQSVQEQFGPGRNQLIKNQISEIYTRANIEGGPSMQIQPATDTYQAQQIQNMRNKSNYQNYPQSQYQNPLSSNNLFIEGRNKQNNNMQNSSTSTHQQIIAQAAQVAQISQAMRNQQRQQQIDQSRNQRFQDHQSQNQLLNRHDGMSNAAPAGPGAGTLYEGMEQISQSSNFLNKNQSNLFGARQNEIITDNLHQSTNNRLGHILESQGAHEQLQSNIGCPISGNQTKLMLPTQKNNEFDHQNIGNNNINFIGNLGIQQANNGGRNQNRIRNSSALLQNSPDYLSQYQNISQASPIKRRHLNSIDKNNQNNPKSLISQINDYQQHNQISNDQIGQVPYLQQQLQKNNTQQKFIKNMYPNCLNMGNGLFDSNIDNDLIQNQLQQQHDSSNQVQLHKKDPGLHTQQTPSQLQRQFKPIQTASSPLINLPQSISARELRQSSLDPPPGAAQGFYNLQMTQPKPHSCNPSQIINHSGGQGGIANQQYQHSLQQTPFNDQQIYKQQSNILRAEAGNERNERGRFYYEYNQQQIQNLQGLDQNNQYGHQLHNINPNAGQIASQGQKQQYGINPIPQPNTAAATSQQMNPHPSQGQKETLKISERFVLKQKLGQGTFSFIYQAYDKLLLKDVALKVEKKDKNKSILLFEYNVLLALKDLKHVCNVYDFVKNSEQNLIVMDLLGSNLAKIRKLLEINYSLKIAIQLLIEMLEAIEEVHNRGFIHRDVKASNFVLSQDYKEVYIVDFGLAKKHLDASKNPYKQRKKADFRGTVSFASLNAHNNIDLSRRDDLWSLYFVILDFLEEKLNWREVKEYTMDQVKDIKTRCLNNPESKLWDKTRNIQEVKNIYNYIKELQYEDKPNYEFIKQQLINIYENYQPLYVTSSSQSNARISNNTLRVQNLQKSIYGNMQPQDHYGQSTLVQEAGAQVIGFIRRDQSHLINSSPCQHQHPNILSSHHIQPQQHFYQGAISDGDGIGGAPSNQLGNQGLAASASHGSNLSPRGGIIGDCLANQNNYSNIQSNQYNRQVNEDGMQQYGVMNLNYTNNQDGRQGFQSYQSILHQDDQSKKKMFQEFFSQILPSNNHQQTSRIYSSQHQTLMQPPPAANQSYQPSSKNQNRMSRAAPQQIVPSTHRLQQLQRPRQIYDQITPLPQQNDPLGYQLAHQNQETPIMPSSGIGGEHQQLLEQQQNVLTKHQQTTSMNYSNMKDQVRATAGLVPLKTNNPNLLSDKQPHNQNFLSNQQELVSNNRQQINKNKDNSDYQRSISQCYDQQDIVLSNNQNEDNQSNRICLDIYNQNTKQTSIIADNDIRGGSLYQLNSQRETQNQTNKQAQGFQHDKKDIQQYIANVPDNNMRSNYKMDNLNDVNNSNNFQQRPIMHNIQNKMKRMHNKISQNNSNNYNTANSGGQSEKLDRKRNIKQHVKKIMDEQPIYQVNNPQIQPQNNLLQNNKDQLIQNIQKQSIQLATQSSNHNMNSNISIPLASIEGQQGPQTQIDQIPQQLKSQIQLQGSINSNNCPNQSINQQQLQGSNDHLQNTNNKQISYEQAADKQNKLINESEQLQSNGKKQIDEHNKMNQQINIEQKIYLTQPVLFVNQKDLQAQLNDQKQLQQQQKSDNSNNNGTIQSNQSDGLKQQNAIQLLNKQAIQNTINSIKQPSKIEQQLNVDQQKILIPLRQTVDLTKQQPNDQNNSQMNFNTKSQIDNDIDKKDFESEEFHKKLQNLMDLQNKGYELRPISYTYYPELYDMIFNSKLKSQYKAFEKQLRSNSLNQNQLLKKIHAKLKIFQTERISRQNDKRASNSQFDDHLTFNNKEFISLCHNANLQNISTMSYKNNSNNAGMFEQQFSNYDHQNHPSSLQMGEQKYLQNDPGQNQQYDTNIRAIAERGQGANHYE